MDLEEIFFPWIKVIRKKMLKSFPVVKEKTLDILLDYVHDELKNLDLEDTYRAGILYDTLSYFHFHFTWKVNWNEESYLLLCCVQLLYYITYVALILSSGNVQSPWLNKAVSTLNFYSDKCEIICDVLLLIRNIPSKYLSAYREILRSALIGRNIRRPVDAQCFIKIMLLIRRFKSLIPVDDTDKRTDIYNLASKVNCPVDTINFLSTVNNDDECRFTERNIFKKFLNKNLKGTFIKNLFEILFRNKYSEKLMNFSANIKRKSKRTTNISVRQNNLKVCRDIKNKLKHKIKKNGAKEEKNEMQVLKKSKRKKNRRKVRSEKELVGSSGTVMPIPVSFSGEQHVKPKVNSHVDNQNWDNFQVQSREVLNCEKTLSKKLDSKKRAFSTNSDSFADGFVNNLSPSRKNKKRKTSNIVSYENEDAIFKNSNSLSDRNQDSHCSESSQITTIHSESLIFQNKEIHYTNATLNGEARNFCSKNLLLLNDNDPISEKVVSKPIDSNKKDKFITSSSPVISDRPLVSSKLHKHNKNSSLCSIVNDANQIEAHTENFAPVDDEKCISNISESISRNNVENDTQPNDVFKTDVSQDELVHSKICVQTKEGKECVEIKSEILCDKPLCTSTITEGNTVDYLDINTTCFINGKCDNDLKLCSEENIYNTSTPSHAQKSCSTSASYTHDYEHFASPESLDLNVSSVVSEYSKEHLLENSRNIYTTTDSSVSLSSESQEIINPKEVKRKKKEKEKLSKSNSKSLSVDEIGNLNNLSTAGTDEISLEHHTKAMNLNSGLFSKLLPSSDNVSESPDNLEVSVENRKAQTLQTDVKASLEPKVCSLSNGDFTDSIKGKLGSKSKDVFSTACNESDELSTPKRKTSKSVINLKLSLKAENASPLKIHSKDMHNKKAVDLSPNKLPVNRQKENHKQIQDCKEKLINSVYNENTSKIYKEKQQICRKYFPDSSSSSENELNTSINEAIETLDNSIHDIAETSVVSSENSLSKNTNVSEVKIESVPKSSLDMSFVTNANANLNKCFDSKKEDRRCEILLEDKKIMLDHNSTFIKNSTELRKREFKKMNITIEPASEISSDSCYELNESNHISEENEFNSDSSDELNVTDRAASFNSSIQIQSKNIRLPESKVKTINSLKLCSNSCTNSTNNEEECETLQEIKDNCKKKESPLASSSIDKNTNSEKKKCRQRLIFEFLPKSNQIICSNNEKFATKSPKGSTNLLVVEHSLNSPIKTQLDALQTQTGVITSKLPSSFSAINSSQSCNECTNSPIKTQLDALQTQTGVTSKLPLSFSAINASQSCNECISTDKLEQSKTSSTFSRCSTQFHDLNNKEDMNLKLQNFNDFSDSGSNLKSDENNLNQKVSYSSDQNSDTLPKNMKNATLKKVSKRKQTKSRRKISPSNKDSCDNQNILKKIAQDLCNKNVDPELNCENCDTYPCNFELTKSSHHTLSKNNPISTEEVHLEEFHTSKLPLSFSAINASQSCNECTSTDKLEKLEQSKYSSPTFSRCSTGYPNFNNKEDINLKLQNFNDFPDLGNNLKCGENVLNQTVDSNSDQNSDTLPENIKNVTLKKVYKRKQTKSRRKISPSNKDSCDNQNILKKKTPDLCNKNVDPELNCENCDTYPCNFELTKSSHHTLSKNNHISTEEVHLVLQDKIQKDTKVNENVCGLSTELSCSDHSKSSNSSLVNSMLKNTYETEIENLNSHLSMKSGPLASSNYSSDSNKTGMKMHETHANLSQKSDTMSLEVYPCKVNKLASNDHDVNISQKSDDTMSSEITLCKVSQLASNDSHGISSVHDLSAKENSTSSLQPLVLLDKIQISFSHENTSMIIEKSPFKQNQKSLDISDLSKNESSNYFIESNQLGENSNYSSNMSPPVSETNLNNSNCSSNLSPPIKFSAYQKGKKITSDSDSNSFDNTSVKKINKDSTSLKHATQNKSGNAVSNISSCFKKKSRRLAPKSERSVNKSHSKNTSDDSKNSLNNALPESDSVISSKKHSLKQNKLSMNKCHGIDPGSFINFSASEAESDDSDCSPDSELGDFIVSDHVSEVESEQELNNSVSSTSSHSFVKKINKDSTSLEHATQNKSGNEVSDVSSCFKKKSRRLASKSERSVNKSHSKNTSDDSKNSLNNALPESDSVISSKKHSLKRSKLCMDDWMKSHGVYPESFINFSASESEYDDSDCAPDSELEDFIASDHLSEVESEQELNDSVSSTRSRCSSKSSFVRRKSQRIRKNRIITSESDGDSSDDEKSAINTQQTKLGSKRNKILSESDSDGFCDRNSSDTATKLTTARKGKSRNFRKNKASNFKRRTSCDNNSSNNIKKNLSQNNKYGNSETNRTSFEIGCSTSNDQNLSNNFNAALTVPNKSSSNYLSPKRDSRSSIKHDIRNNSSQSNQSVNNVVQKSVSCKLNSNSSHNLPDGVINSKGRKRKYNKRTVSLPPQNPYNLRKRKSRSNLTDTTLQPDKIVPTNQSSVSSNNHAADSDSKRKNSDDTFKNIHPDPVQNSINSNSNKLQVASVLKVNCGELADPYPLKNKKVLALHSTKKCSTPKKILSSNKVPLNVSDTDSDKTCLLQNASVIEKQTDLGVSEKSDALYRDLHISDDSERTLTKSPDSLYRDLHISDDSERTLTKSPDSLDCSSELSTRSKSEIENSSIIIQKRRTINSTVNNKKEQCIRFTNNKQNVSKNMKQIQGNSVKEFSSESITDSWVNALPLSITEDKNCGFSVQANKEFSDSFECVSPTQIQKNVLNFYNSSNSFECVSPTQFHNNVLKHSTALDLSKCISPTQIQKNAQKNSAFDSSECTSLTQIPKDNQKNSNSSECASFTHIQKTALKNSCTSDSPACASPMQIQNNDQQNSGDSYEYIPPTHIQKNGLEKSNLLALNNFKNFDNYQKEILSNENSCSLINPPKDIVKGNSSAKNLSQSVDGDSQGELDSLKLVGLFQKNKNGEMSENTLLSHTQKNIQKDFEKSPVKTNHKNVGNLSQLLKHFTNSDKTVFNLQKNHPSAYSRLFEKHLPSKKGAIDLTLKKTQKPPDVFSQNEPPCNDLLYGNMENSDHFVTSEKDTENLSQEFSVDSGDERLMCYVVDKLENDSTSLISDNFLKVDNFIECPSEQNLANNVISSDQHIKPSLLCNDNNILPLKTKDLSLNTSASIVNEPHLCSFNPLNTIHYSQVLQYVPKANCDVISSKNCIVDTNCSISLSRVDSFNLDTSSDKTCFVNTNYNTLSPQIDPLNLDPCIELIQSDELTNSGKSELQSSNSSDLSLDHQLCQMGFEKNEPRIIQTKNVKSCSETAMKSHLKQSISLPQKFVIICDVKEKSYQVCELPEEIPCNTLNKPTVTHSESQTDINDSGENIYKTNKKVNDCSPEEFIIVNGTKLSKSSFDPVVNIGKKCDDIEIKSNNNNKIGTHSSRVCQKSEKITKQSVRKRKNKLCGCPEC